MSNSSLFKRAALAAKGGIITAFSSGSGGGEGKGIYRVLRGRAGLSKLRAMVCGGAPLMPQTAEFFENMGIDFINGYGLTETAPVLTVNYGGPRESVGKAVEGVSLRITDPNSEGVGMVEALVPNKMKCYYNDPEATGRVLSGGWLKTGDMGYMDREGYLYLKGRKDNLIISEAGKNIYPEEIEAGLVKSIFISECMVYGASAGRGDRCTIIRAIIYPDYESVDDYFIKQGIKETPESVRSLIKDEIKNLNESLPDYKKIGNFRIQQEEFQKTTLQKIKRYLYAEQ